MRYFQFFDDWLLDGHRDLERGYGRPTLVHVVDNLKNACFQTIHKTPEGRYRMWYRPLVHFPEPGKPDQRVRGRVTPGFEQGRKRAGYAFCYAESDDGIHFDPVGVPVPDPRLPGHTNAMAVPEYCWLDDHTYAPCEVFLDERDPDSARRYKALIQNGRMLTSPDGFRWSDSGIHTFRTPGNQGSDTDNHLCYNPQFRRYQVMHRPGHWDRRVAITQSGEDDPTSWGEPRVVLSPDVLDPPCHQFQGFPYYPYEDMWIGWLQHFDCRIEERVDRRKTHQKFHEELCYSHDGLYWQRTRHTFFDKPDPPAYGAGFLQTRNIVDEGDVVRMYSSGSIGFAGRGAAPPKRALDYGLDAERLVLVWELRKDGFCYLQPKAGYGKLWTRGIVPQDADFTVNVLAPYGWLKMQLTDEANNPLPGFSFGEFDPISGDHVAVRPRWRNADLADAVGKWCRIDMEFMDARLYAFRWHAKLAYTNDNAAKTGSGDSFFESL